MNMHNAIAEACSQVGIIPPKVIKYGRWLLTDTLSGKNGRGDGRVIVNDESVTGWNWQTGLKATVWLKSERSISEQRQIRESIARNEAEKRDAAKRATIVANKIILASKLHSHEYLASKGFPTERALIVGAETVQEIGGSYLIPKHGRRAVVVPARIGQSVTSLQLIWEDGTKKFIAGGRIGGASHRVSRGRDTWLCEGFSTGLSLRTAIRSLNRSDSILCCFSASNIEVVANGVPGRSFIAADNDKPLDQFKGLGAGEFYAKKAEKPFLMPAHIGFDVNDLHQAGGIFAVQKLITKFLREVA